MFFLDESMCEKLGIPYCLDGEGSDSAHIGDLLAKNDWDDHHRSIMAGFIRGGIFVMKLEKTSQVKEQGYGWFKILNYPTFINPSEA
tara:strand:- start:620 stop:880 length:261 start_codon:yes stop_codon:yes gene_type:complete